MEIPEEIIFNCIKYNFIKQVNSNLFLYESQYGYKECFSKFDLGLIPSFETEYKENRSTGRWAKFGGY